MKTEEIIESVEEMSVKELSDLVEAIEERFDVSAQAAAPAAAAAGAEGESGEEEEEEEDTFEVVLIDPGQKKIQVIKQLKEITGKGLKECKSLVDDLPATIKEGLEEEDAEDIKDQLEEQGAEMELR